MFCIMGFQTHMLPLSYNFHKYMVRSMEDEFHTIVRAAVENLADHSEIVCHDCRSRFVETIPSHPESPPSGTAEFVDEMALGSQFVQVLHLIAQVVCEEAEPPLVPQNCIDPPSDDDFLRIELDGWGNGNDNFAHEDWEDGESEYQSENEKEEREMGISWPLWGYAILCIFINIHGLNIYFWLSFIPNILVLLVGTKLKHVVSVLALEIAEPSGPSGETQVKPRDALFWFGKPGIILRLIQFISFQVRKIITD